MEDNSIIGQLSFELGIDRNSLTRSLTQATRDADRQLTSGFSGIAKKVSGILGGIAIGSFVKDCLDLGSDLAEVQNVVDTAFKSMSGYVDSFAKNAMESFGLSETVAKKYMGTIGAMNNAFGFAEKESYKMAEAVTGLAGDVASFYNLSSDEAFTKLKSIWTGETETLKDLGVVMTQTALDQYALNNGFGKTTAKMTEQEKVMLRFQYVTSCLSDATGDFLKTQDSWANQTRVLSLRFESLKATLGQGFINLFTPIIKGLNTLLAKLSTVAEGFKTFTEVITGKTAATESLGNIASVANEAAGSVDNITASAKAAQKQLMGFDKITKLSDSTDSGTSSDISSGEGGIAGNVAVEVDTGNADTAIKEIRKQLDNFKKWAVQSFGPSFKNIWKDFQDNTQTFKNNLGKAFSDIKSLGPPFTEYFNGPFTEHLVTSFETAGIAANGLYDTFNTVFSDIWNNAVFPVLSNFVTVGLPMMTEFDTQMQILGGNIFSALKDCFDKVWSEGAAPALTLISDMWIDLMNTISDFWNKWGQPIFDKLNEVVQNTGAVFLDIWDNILKPTWEHIMSAVDELWTEHLQPLVANFLDFVGEFITGASDIYNKFILPVVSYVANVFGPAFVSGFKLIVDIVKNAIAVVADIIDGIITTLKGVIQFVTGVFTGDWDKAWKGIKNILKGIIDTFASIFLYVWNQIKTIWSGATSFFSNIWSGIKACFSGVADWFKNIFTQAWTNVKNVFSAGGKIFSGIISGIEDSFKNVVNHIISGINNVIAFPFDKINGMLNKIRSISILGVEPFKELWDKNPLSVPKIPKLAQGGYVKPNTPQLAMIGDNRHQGEVVAPEKKLDELLQKAVAASSGGCDREILMVLKEILAVLKELDLDIVIDGKRLKDIIVQKINEHTRQTGVCEINF